MRVLSDACVPQRLRHELAGYDVQSCGFAGLDGLLDTDLIDAMAGRFGVLVTCDRSLQWQQNMQGRSISILVLRASSNRFADLLPLVPALIEALAELQPGEVREVTA